MSRGPGRVERAIAAAVAANPHHAVSVDEVCVRLYPPTWGGGTAKKYRVAIIRGGKALARRDSNNIGYVSSWGPGSTVAFYAADELEAYGHAKLKAMGGRRGGHDGRSRQSLLETLYKHYMAPGGRWWLDVRLFIAARDGDAERAAEHRHAIEQYEENRRKMFEGIR